MELSPSPPNCKRLLEIIPLVYIYQLAKFGDLESCGLKDIFKNVRCYMYVHHEVTNLVNCQMVQNAKFWISWERKIAFLQNKRNLNLCLRWHMLRSYRFVAEVTFNGFCFIEITNFSNKFKQVRIARKQKNIQLTWLVIQFNPGQ